MMIPHSRPWIIEQDRQSVMRTLETGMIASGSGTQELERAMLERTGAIQAIACASGTAALGLALRALEIGPGDDVILPSYVCWNVLAAVTSLGANPILCDVNESAVMTVATVSRVMTPGTAAIIAVHTFGHVCDVQSLKGLGIPIIEDACQAFGLSVSGRPAGSLGSLGCLSFHATKCLTSGEGGMVLVNDSALAVRLRGLADTEIRYNGAGASVLSDMQAALALSQLRRYDEFLRIRRQLFSKYDSVLQELSLQPGYSQHTDFLFRFTLRSRQSFERLREEFLSRGIHVRRGVDELLHRRLGYSDAGFPVSLRLFEETLSLPFYPALERVEVDTVVQGMREIFREN